MNLDRKAFLKRGMLLLGEMVLQPGRIVAPPDDRVFLRPPGFVDGKIGSCAGCELCLDACPDSLLVNRDGSAGPVFEPSRGGCTFCMECAGACPHGVLDPAESGRPVRLGLAVPDNGRCLAGQGGCFTCLEQCPEGAITIEIGKGVTVDPDGCTGCGVCEYICPLGTESIQVKCL